MLGGIESTGRGFSDVIDAQSISGDSYAVLNWWVGVWEEAVSDLFV